MKLLVVGGAGYIGSHFVKESCAKGYDVVVVDNLVNGHKESVDPKAVFCEGDIRDQDFLKSVFKEHLFDAVVHFAAFSLVGVSVKEPNEYFDNNVYGTISLLETMKEYGVKKIVFSSSAAVYGSHDVMPITEEYDTKPTNPYGETKLMMEKMMNWADLAYEMKYVSLRYFNVAGASYDHSIGEDHHPETHLIPLILQVPLGKRDHITIFGNDYQTKDGTCVRDYIHIEDLVKAHLMALDYLFQGNNSNIFNLGSENGYSNLEVLNAARKVTGVDIKMEMGPRRAGDPDKLVASHDKASRILGWKPTKSLEEIIASAWAFHVSHPNGFMGDEHE